MWIGSFFICRVCREMHARLRTSFVSILYQKRVVCCNMRQLQCCKWRCTIFRCVLVLPGLAPLCMMLLFAQKCMADLGRRTDDALQFLTWFFALTPCTTRSVQNYLTKLLILHIYIHSHTHRQHWLSTLLLEKCIHCSFCIRNDGFHCNCLLWD